MPPCSSERADSTDKPQFITVSHCNLGGNWGRKRARGRGYWIQATLLTKQFQQVETCFWMSNNTPTPPLLAFSCPPLLFFALRFVNGPHFHFSRIDFTLHSDGKASLVVSRNPDLHIFIIQTIGELKKWWMMSVVDTQQGFWSEYPIKEKGTILFLRCFLSNSGTCKFL